MNRLLGALVVLACGCGARGETTATPTRPASPGITLDWSAPECLTATSDVDADGVNDACELALATAFAPVLVVNPSGCNWDAAASPPRLGGAYFFAVQRRGEALRIGYLPAYFRDCGWRGAKCLLPLVDCDAHEGDSELIVIDVVADGNRWRTARVFLSAHCFARTEGDCRWYEGEALAQFTWHNDAIGGAPVVWVAEGRQANYPSRSACDRGHHRIDTCDRNTHAYRFPIRSSAQNAGSRARPLSDDGCITGAELPLPSTRALDAAVECIWVSRPFAGWQEAQEGTTEYAHYLATIAGF